MYVDSNSFFFSPFFSFFFPFLFNSCECVSDVQHIHAEEGSALYFSAQTLTGRVNVGSDIPPLSLLQGAEAASSVSW